MGEQQLLDLGLEETVEETPAKEEKNEPKAKTPKKRTKKKETTSTTTDQKETPTGKSPKGTKGDVSTDGGATKQPENKESDQGKSKSASEPRDLTQWDTANIIGTPKGRVNPYFKGVIGESGLETGKPAFAPFDEIKSIQRQVYVDDITLENPTIQYEKYYVVGSFYEVVFEVSKEVFEEMLISPLMPKTLKIRYSWVSSHVTPKRNYLVDHDALPTKEEIKAIDQKDDAAKWAMMNTTDREKYKKEKENKGESSDHLNEEQEVDIQPNDTENNEE